MAAATSTAAAQREGKERRVDDGDGDGDEDVLDAAGESNRSSENLHVVVIVLGDLGRSPRMQYHAASLLDAGHTVSLIGYEGEDLVPALQDYERAEKDRFHVIRFRVPSPKIIQRFLMLYFVWRILSLSLWLLWALFRRVPSTKERPVNCLLVQNPPALPLLSVTYLYCRCKSILQGNHVGWVIDWHNLGYSMLRSGSAFQRVAKSYEHVMAPLADGHLTVTKAMREHLIHEMDIRQSSSNMKVLYDCPPSMFRPLSPEEQHEILRRLDQQLRKAVPTAWLEDIKDRDGEDVTLLTERLTDGRYVPRRGRPALVTSSTSWTPDEDFGILLAALIMLDDKIEKKKKKKKDYPSSTRGGQGDELKVLAVITGKGPQKALYERKMSRLDMSNVAVQTLWLEPGDYPKLLACADLGVSLHTSTSGLDLPMKVLDLFGCHVPVCAAKFAALPELVQDQHNGRVFDSCQELADQLWTLLDPLTETRRNDSSAPCHRFGELERYSNHLLGRKRWDENWIANALPVVLEASSTRGAENKVASITSSSKED